MPLSDYLFASDGNGPADRGIVTQDRNVGDMSLITDSVHNWPHRFIAMVGDTDTDGQFVPGTITVFKGVLTGGIVTIESFAPGYSDIGNTENQTVLIRPATAWADEVAQSIEDAPSKALYAKLISGDASSLAFWRGLEPGWYQADNGSVTNLPMSMTYAYIRVLQPEVEPVLRRHVELYNVSSTFDSASNAVAWTSIGVVSDANLPIQWTNHFLMAHPIGSIYMSVSSTNPGTSFGGTWVSWGSGRVPVGVDTGQTEFDTVEKTGGAKTHTLTEAQMPAHNHNLRSDSRAKVSLYGGGSSGGAAEGLNFTRDNSYNNSLWIENKGGGQAHNNLQPYITCYIWKRTA